jgi:ribosomal protein L11 methyltransferase
VEDSDWKDNWKEYFKPAKITERIVIKPTWEAYERTDDELVIEIDPGMAFGTGTHPTTSLCVKLLERYLEPEKDMVLDVGCGSGILSTSIIH